MPMAAGTPCEVVAEEGHVAGGERRLRAAADGAADVGRGQRRGVVDPVADHDHPLGGGVEPPSASTLPGRAESAVRVVDPEV